MKRCWPRFSYGNMTCQTSTRLHEFLRGAGGAPSVQLFLRRRLPVAHGGGAARRGAFCVVMKNQSYTMVGRTVQECYLRYYILHARRGARKGLIAGRACGLRAGKDGSALKSAACPLFLRATSSLRKNVAPKRVSPRHGKMRRSAQILACT